MYRFRVDIPVVCVWLEGSTDDDVGDNYQVDPREDIVELWRLLHSYSQYNWKHKHTGYFMNST